MTAVACANDLGPHTRGEIHASTRLAYLLFRVHVLLALSPSSRSTGYGNRTIHVKLEASLYTSLV